MAEVGKLIERAAEHVSMAKAMGNFGVASRLVEEQASALTALQAENERLEAEVDGLLKSRQAMKDRYRKAAADAGSRAETAEVTLTALQERVAEMEKALTGCLGFIEQHYEPADDADYLLFTEVRAALKAGG